MRHDKGGACIRMCTSFFYVYADKLINLSISEAQLGKNWKTWLIHERSFR